MRNRGSKEPQNKEETKNDERNDETKMQGTDS